MFRDVLYNLIGYFYGMADGSEDETLEFYRRMIGDNKHYIKRK